MAAVATRRYLLDTNILVELIRGNQTGLDIANYFDLWNPETELSVSVVTIGELLSLAEQWNWGATNVKIMHRILKKLDVIDVGRDEVLRSYANVDAHCVRIGNEMTGKNDVWIAACANVAALTLLTGDGDFDHLNAVFLTVVRIDPATGQPRTT